MEQWKDAFSSALANALPGQDIVLERPRSAAHGDLAFPCFRAAKALGKNPAELAQSLAASLRIEGVALVAAGPYLNLRLAPADRARTILGAILEAPPPRPFGSGAPHDERVIVEYSSPNIAKLFTIGHLRSTMIGHALVQLHRFLGAQVIRLNHLGDWGTQFGTLLAAYKRWAEADNPQLDRDFDWIEGDVPEQRRTPLYRLFQLYVRFHAEEAADPDMRDQARDWFRRLEAGDGEARRLWTRFRQVSLAEFQRIYMRLGIAFDSLEMGEAFYEDQLAPALARLEAAGLLREGEGGARIVDLQDAGIQTPCLVQKADGTSIYATRDLAAALYRQRTWEFDRCLYVVGGEQVLHFQQLFAMLEKLDPWFKGRMQHVPFGLIQLPEGKMSTRKGNVIFLEDVLDEAVQRVLAVIAEKNPELPDREKVAEMLGLGAVVFFDALNDRVKPITFTWDRVIALDGDTGPYVQYAHARIMSVLRKGTTDLTQKDLVEFWRHATPERSPDGTRDCIVFFRPVRLRNVPAEILPPGVEVQPVGLDHPSAQELLFELAGFPSAVRMAREASMATPLARQLLAIAKAFSGFYTNCPILKGEFEDRNIQRWRLALCVATARVIRQGLFLMGIQAPEEM